MMTECHEPNGFARARLLPLESDMAQHARRERELEFAQTNPIQAKVMAPSIDPEQTDPEQTKRTSSNEPGDSDQTDRSSSNEPSHPEQRNRSSAMALPNDRTHSTIKVVCFKLDGRVSGLVDAITRAGAQSEGVECGELDHSSASDCDGLIIVFDPLTQLSGAGGCQFAKTMRVESSRRTVWSSPSAQARMLVVDMLHCVRVRRSSMSCGPPLLEEAGELQQCALVQDTLFALDGKMFDQHHARASEIRDKISAASAQLMERVGSVREPLPLMWTVKMRGANTDDRPILVYALDCSWSSANLCLDKMDEETIAQLWIRVGEVAVATLRHRRSSVPTMVRDEPRHYLWMTIVSSVALLFFFFFLSWSLSLEILA
jgi:hypothetical protein